VQEKKKKLTVCLKEHKTQNIQVEETSVPYIKKHKDYPNFPSKLSYT
jgi:hypothetical protein